MAVRVGIPGIEPSRHEAVYEVCARHGVRQLTVFGSRARGQAHASSDLDVLVEFANGRDPDLFELGALQQDLSEAAGVDVDLKTRDMFSPHGLTHALRSAVVAYAA